MKYIFLSKDIVICDLVWTHPDVTRIHGETVRDPEFVRVYISYEIFQYPADRVESESEPIFIFTKRGCVDPKFGIYKTRSGAFRRLEKEKENWNEDVENFRTLLVIGKVAST